MHGDLEIRALRAETRAYFAVILAAIRHLAHQMEIDMSELDDDLAAIAQVADDIHTAVDQVIQVINGATSLTAAERQQIADALANLHSSADRLNVAVPAPADPGAGAEIPPQV
jgi:hypothetical protein